MFISDNSKISKFTVNKLSEFLEHVQPFFNNIPAVSHAPFFNKCNNKIHDKFQFSEVNNIAVFF